MFSELTYIAPEIHNFIQHRFSDTFSGNINDSFAKQNLVAIAQIIVSKF